MKDRRWEQLVHDHQGEKELEDAKREREAAMKETAAALVAGTSPLAKGSYSWVPTPKRLKRWFVATVTTTALFGALFFSLQVWTEPKLDQAAWLDKVEKLTTLATAQARVKTVLEYEDNKLFGKEISVDLPGTKRKVLLIVPATVTAGIEINDFSADNFQINEDKKMVSIRLPKASLLSEPSLDFEHTETFSHEEMFRHEVNWEEGYQFAQKASDLAEQEAISLGILKVAEENAVKVMKEFFHELGYAAEIEFEK